MNDHDLGELIADAVADVEPADRLAEIRRATTQARRTRRTWYAGCGALLAAAVTVTAFVVVSPGDDSSEPDPIAKDPGGPVPVYYVGPGPDGPDAPDEVLYRYTETGSDPLSLLMATPSDPDYSTPWPKGSLVSYEVEATRILVLVDGGPINDELARQQLIYTLQESTGERLPVELVYADARALPIAPVERASIFDALSLMSIDTPAEGASFSDSFTATGRANVFEASLACNMSGDGGEFGPFLGTAGYLQPRLYPWEARVDLTDVPPGTYTFTCATEDMSGGTEGFGAYTDTRTITVE